MPCQAELEIGDRHRLDLGAVDDEVVLEVAVQHDHHRALIAHQAADEAVPHERETVVSDRLDPHPVAVLEPLLHPTTSASTASDSSGHSLRASVIHSSVGRSVSAISAQSAIGSTHIIVPAPPK